MKKEEKMMLRRELKLSWSIRLSLVNFVNNFMDTTDRYLFSDKVKK